MKANSKHMYSMDAIIGLIHDYEDIGGNAYQITDGSDDYGTWIFWADGYKTVICKQHIACNIFGEEFISYSIRQYNETPLKYKTITNEPDDRLVTLTIHC